MVQIQKEIIIVKSSKVIASIIGAAMIVAAASTGNVHQDAISHTDVYYGTN